MPRASFSKSVERFATSLSVAQAHVRAAADRHDLRPPLVDGEGEAHDVFVEAPGLGEIAVVEERDRQFDVALGPDHALSSRKRTSSAGGATAVTPGAGRGTARPAPGVPRYSPSRTITSPRRSTVSGHPVTVVPVHGL